MSTTKEFPGAGVLTRSAAVRTVAGERLELRARTPIRSRVETTSDEGAVSTSFEAFTGAPASWVAVTFDGKPPVAPFA